MKIIEAKSVRTEIKRRIEIDYETIRQLVNPLIEEGDITVSADIYVMVPGGADWSNTSLDIGGDTPLIIEWTEVTDDEK